MSDLESREGWPAGPWDAEPDKLELEFYGFPCAIHRIPYVGALCGYVSVPRGHPWFGQSFDDIDVDVHGGLTFAAPHRRGAATWWVGFDCSHSGDKVPGAGSGHKLPGAVYRDLEYVKAELERLAEQAHHAVFHG